MRFVLIDRLLELEPGKRALGRKTFAPSDDFLTDHFPGFAVVPGVLVTEAMGQVGGWLLATTLDFSHWPLLIMINDAKFHRFVVPGDEIQMEASIRSARQHDFEIDAEARVRNERVARARLLFHAFAFDLGELDSRAFQGWARTTFRDIGGEALLGRSCGRSIDA